MVGSQLCLAADLLRALNAERKREGKRRDAELIEATSQALAAVGLEGTTVRLSDRRFLAALAQSAGLPEASWDGFFIILDKLDKIGWDGVRNELEGLGLPSNSIATALVTAIGALAGSKLLRF